MNAKKLVSVLTLSMGLSVTHPHVARAGGPPPPNTTGAAVRGVVHFEGKVPAAKAISMAVDPVCAKQHPSPILAQEVMTDAKGDLANVVVFVSEGLGDRTFDPPAQPAVVEQKGCMYEPHVMAVRANQKLELVNDDATSHNIHPVPANNREWNKAEPPGSKMEDSFAREEIAIPVKCNVHPWMRGYIAVFKHPYFAVTGKDGSFDIGSLPPGTYTINAGHASPATPPHPVPAGAGPPTAGPVGFTGGVRRGDPGALRALFGKGGGYRSAESAAPPKSEDWCTTKKRGALRHQGTAGSSLPLRAGSECSARE